MIRINKYFYTGCVSFTIINFITLIIHYTQRRMTINVNSEINMLAIIFFIQIVCWLIEGLSIKNSILHIIFELVICCGITFGIGIRTGLIEYVNPFSLSKILFIIVITYVITVFSFYLSVKKDENEINYILSKVNHQK